MTEEFLEERFFALLEDEYDYMIAEEMGFDLPSCFLPQGPYLAPFQIYDDRDVKLYLKKGVKLAEVPLNQELFCVLNLEDYYLTSDYKSLVFYENGFLAKTKEPSNAIMKRNFAHLGISYEFMRAFLHSLIKEERHQTPYVLGKFRFLPIDGPSKRDVTWVSLTHLTKFYKIYSDRTKSRLEFCDRHIFDLPIRYLSMERQLEWAEQMYNFQYEKAHQCIKCFDHEVREDVRIPDVRAEEIANAYLLMMWKKQTKRCPNRSNPDFEKANRYIERKFSNKV